MQIKQCHSSKQALHTANIRNQRQIPASSTKRVATEALQQFNTFARKYWYDRKIYKSTEKVPHEHK